MPSLVFALRMQNGPFSCHSISHTLKPSLLLHRFVSMRSSSLHLRSISYKEQQRRQRINWFCIKSITFALVLKNELFHTFINLQRFHIHFSFSRLILTHLHTWDNRMKRTPQCQSRQICTSTSRTCAHKHNDASRIWRKRSSWWLITLCPSQSVLDWKSFVFFASMESMCQNKNA